MADRLDEAFRALREERSPRDGESPEADATLERVLASRKTDRRRRLRAWKVFLPMAAVLVASTAWASATGRLQSMWTALVAGETADTVATHHADRSDGAPTTLPTESLPAPSAAPVAPELEDHDARASNELVPADTSRPDPSVALAAPSALASATVARAAPSGSVATRGTAAPAASDASLAADKADFEAAYRVHASGAAAESVAAWDAYLAAHPSGRFGPEARYARAVALVRAGRTAAARAALRPFADAAEGAYRREDARRLLESIGD